MTLPDLLDRYVAELEAAGIRDPYAEAFTLAAVLIDLYRLAGEPLPLALVADLNTRAGAPRPAA